MVLDKLGLKITFKLERPPDIPDLLVINMLAQNSGSTTLTDFLFQAAVPRVRHHLQLVYMCYITLRIKLIQVILFIDIPIANVIAVEYRHSAVWSSNPSAESHKYEQSKWPILQTTLVAQLFNF